MDELDRRIIDALQDGLPICERPFARAAESFGVAEEVLLARIECLLAEGYLSRFGPLYHAERMGGAFSLCALSAPAQRFDEIAALVNDHPEVAHNYERDHALNMWFVLATEAPEDVGRVLKAIEEETGCRVYDFPKVEEFFVGLKLRA